MTRSTIIAGMVAATALLGACSPAETVRAVDSRPVLEIKGAPSGAHVFIDNLDMGEANTALKLEPGTHLVQVKQGPSAVYQEKVFLSGAMVRTINMEH